MHVLGVTDHLGNVGGAEISTRTILEGLQNHDSVRKVTVIGAADSGQRRLNFGDVDVVEIEIPEFVTDLPEFAYDLLIERLLERTIRKHIDDVDVIHAHHRRSTLAVSRLETSKPTISTVRDYWPTCPISIYNVDGEPCTGCENRLDDCIRANDWDGYLQPVVERYLLTKRRHQRPALSSVDCAVFIAGHLEARLRESVTLPSRTEVVYNPVSIEDVPEGDRLERPTFVTASSLSKSKGIETAVRAMENVVREHPDARLVVMGDGPERERLEDLASGICPGAVEFRGRVSTDEVYRTMNQATATVFPSIWEEPFGRITVESMMLGTPVVGSDVGGIAEIIEDGETGLLFPPGNSTALGDALSSLLTDVNRQQALSSAAQVQAEQFSPERVVDSYVELYHSMI